MVMSGGIDPMQAGGEAQGRLGSIELHGGLHLGGREEHGQEHTFRGRRPCCNSSPRAAPWMDRPLVTIQVLEPWMDRPLACGREEHYRLACRRRRRGGAAELQRQEEKHHDGSRLDREGELQRRKKLLSLSSIPCYDNMMQLVYIEKPMGRIYITHDLGDKGDKPRPIRTPRPILILLNTKEVNHINIFFNLHKNCPKLHILGLFCCC